MSHTTRPMVRAKESLRPPVLVARDTVGRATQARRAMPAVLLAGGQRCGTTSLYKALDQQPHVFRPVWRKGVHYFDVAYENGLDWYRSHFPLQRALDRAEERWGVPAMCFESSPYYLFHPLAGLRIAETLPDVRLVVLVRDPVERACSAHAHELARGYEHLPLEEALAAEDERLAGEAERLVADPTYVSHAHRHQAYRSRGEYATQLERLAGVVGRERIKVVDSHRFFADPEPVHAELLEWLGTRAVVPTTFEQHNARPHGGLDDAVHRRLRAHYAEHDEALVPWLGGPPSWRS